MQNLLSSFSLLPEALHFVWPLVFWGLPLPFIIYWGVPSAKKEEAALRLPTYAVLAESPTNSSSSTSRIKLLCLTLIWILTVTAVARPQWIGEAIQLPASGRDLLLAVDISQSMETEDMVVDNRQLPRIVIVKAIVNDFVQQRNGDRLGLVVFGTQAFLHVPLTFDRKVVGQQLQEAQLGFAGGATAIGDAIAISVKKLRELPEDKTNGRVLILLTDGANTAGEIQPREASKLAKTAGVKIYTIGLGADSMVEKSFFFSREVNPSRDLDEATLKHIASETGGEYFRARDPQQLQEIYQAINKLEPLPQEAETFRPIKELFYLPLSIAMGISFLWALLQQIFIALHQIKSSKILSSTNVGETRYE